MIWMLALSACLPDIRGKLYEPFDTAGAKEAAKVAVEPDGAGVVKVVIDATSASNWIFLDLDLETLEVEPDTAGWDIALSRQRIKLDGGVSGDAGVEVAVVEAARVEDVTTAPADGYVTDLPDDDDENTEPEYAFDVWFDYNPENHVLTPKDLVFVVRSTDGLLYPVEVLSYYDDAGTSGFMSLRIGQPL
ncbi:MAG: HmuY family protein [Myxococcota bacterium]